MRLLPLVLFLALPAAVQVQFSYTTYNGTFTIARHTGSGGAVTIPSTLNGLPATSIGDYAFYGCSSPNARAVPLKDADSSRTERTQDENQHVILWDPFPIDADAEGAPGEGADSATHTPGDDSDV